MFMCNCQQKMKGYCMYRFSLFYFKLYFRLFWSEVTPDHLMDNVFLVLLIVLNIRQSSLFFIFFFFYKNASFECFWEIIHLLRNEMKKITRYSPGEKKLTGSRYRTCIARTSGVWQMPNHFSSLNLSSFSLIWAENSHDIRDVPGWKQFFMTSYEGYFNTSV